MCGILFFRFLGIINIFFDRTDESLIMSSMTENEKERDPQQEIEETTPLLNDSQPDGELRSKTAAAKVPEVEIHLYKSGKGPIDVFKSNLGGYEQDQLEVRSILEKYGLKSIFAFNVEKGRAVPIRFHPRNGRSVLPYRDGAVIYIDGEPQVISVPYIESSDCFDFEF